MTRKLNYDASSRKRMKSCDNKGGVPWSDLNHDVLYSIMMRLGVVEFLSFSRVCKSWRSLALSKRERFMTSRPPMAMLAHKNTCHLQDFEGKQFKTILPVPHSVDRTCIGVTCGYLILFGEKTRDFWLVNLITRHQLHFPHVPFDVGHPQERVMRAILVFSTSMNGWVFVMLNRFKYKIWFSAGEGAWNHVFSTFPLLDLHPFKGKIYTLSTDYLRSGRHVYEMRLNPVPKLTLFETRFLESVFLALDFISSDQNLYLMEYWPNGLHKVHKLDFDQLNWVPCENKMEEYALFYSCFKQGAVVKPETWAAPSSQYRRFFGNYKPGKGRCLTSKFWYFPHDCLNVNLIDH
ncbi:hypothetical protein Lser_V15G33031 [Lactuca serriola]